MVEVEHKWKLGKWVLSPMPPIQYKGKTLHPMAVIAYDFFPDQEGGRVRQVNLMHFTTSKDLGGLIAVLTKFEEEYRKVEEQVTSTASIVE